MIKDMVAIEENNLVRSMILNESSLLRCERSV